jgi:hypothetical protein
MANLRLGTVCLIVVLSAVYVPAQDTTGAFRYRPAKIDVGTVYHYLKTNIDGTTPEHVSIYVAARDRIESYKFHPKGSRAGLVIATMDWSIFSVTALESWQVFAEKEKVLAATLKYLPGSRQVEVALPFINRPAEKVAIRHLPFHV